MKIVREYDEMIWSDFVLRHNYGNFFQSPEAFKLFEIAGNHFPFSFFCVDDGEILGLLAGVVMSNGSGIKKYFSSRAIIWGGPLINENLDGKKYHDVLALLITEFVSFSKGKAIYSEFRNFFDFGNFSSVFNDFGFEFKEHLNYLVELGSKEKVLSAMSESKRRQIKKGLNKNAIIEEANDENDVLEYYNILSQVYLEKVKKPLADSEFFIKLFNTKNYLKFLLIKFEGKVIGGITSIIFKDRISEWYICGLDKEHKDLYPSVLATYSAIDFGINNNLKYFDFMGAGKPDEDYGVRDFKSKFGGKLVNYGRFFKINNNFFYKIGEAGLKILNKFN